MQSSFSATTSNMYAQGNAGIVQYKCNYHFMVYTICTICTIFNLTLNRLGEWYLYLSKQASPSWPLNRPTQGTIAYSLYSVALLNFNENKATAKNAKLSEYSPPTPKQK